MTIEQDIAKAAQRPQVRRVVTGEATQQLPNGPTLKPFGTEDSLTKDIEESALRHSRMIGNLMERERRASADLATANARIEAMQSTETRLTSEIETLKMQLDAARGEVAFYASTFDLIAGAMQRVRERTDTETGAETYTDDGQADR